MEDFWQRKVKHLGFPKRCLYFPESTACSMNFFAFRHSRSFTKRCLKARWAFLSWSTIEVSKGLRSIIRRFFSVPLCLFHCFKVVVDIWRISLPVASWYLHFVEISPGLKIPQRDLPRKSDLMIFDVYLSYLRENVKRSTPNPKISVAETVDKILWHLKELYKSIYIYLSDITYMILYIYDIICIYIYIYCRNNGDICPCQLALPGFSKRLLPFRPTAPNGGNSVIRWQVWMRILPPGLGKKNTLALAVTWLWSSNPLFCVFFDAPIYFGFSLPKKKKKPWILVRQQKCLRPLIWKILAVDGIFLDDLEFD